MADPGDDGEGGAAAFSAELARAEAGQPASSASMRIELADLRERIRKLEAIAASVDL